MPVAVDQSSVGQQGAVGTLSGSYAGTWRIDGIQASAEENLREKVTVGSVGFAHEVAISIAIDIAEGDRLWNDRSRRRLQSCKASACCGDFDCIS